jgi:TetR/AcrR family transcriptional regulator
MAKKGTGTTLLQSPKKLIRKRNPEKTKHAILSAATAEFCKHGLKGARVDAIAARSKCNIRLMYQYFGNKTEIYRAVLEHVYSHIRAEERSLKLGGYEPVDGMRRLIDFTFTFFGHHHEYVTLINNENMLGAKYVAKSPTIRSLTLPLIATIEDLLNRGQRIGIFHKHVDAIQLYISITALSYFHISNRFTLSAMFNKDITRNAWLEARREHAREMVLTWLTRDAHK